MKRLLFLLILLPVPTFSASELGRPGLSDEDYQKRVKGLYGVLSDREPQITEVESALLAKISPLLEQAPQNAQLMLESMLSDGKPVSSAFNQILGNLYVTAKRYKEGEREFRAAIRKFPDFQRAWSSLGSLKMQQEDYPAASGALAKSIELGAADAQTYGMLAYALLHERQYIAAEVAYNMAMLRDPGEIGWLEGKARILAETGRNAETIAATDQLLASNPGRLEYWRLQANAYLGLGELEETVRSLEIARLVGELDAGALHLLGNVYMKLSMPDHALGAYLAAMKQQPDSPPGVLLNVARTLLNENQNDLARRLLATLQPDPETWPVRDQVNHQMMTARLALIDGGQDAALVALDRVLELDPVNVEGLFRISQLHTEMGHSEKAYYYLAKIQGDEKYEYAAQMLLTQMLIKEGRLDDSLVSLRKAIRLSPNADLEKLYNQVRVAVQSQSKG